MINKKPKETNKTNIEMLIEKTLRQIINNNMIIIKLFIIFPF